MELKQATKDDALKLFELRNEPEVMSQSLNDQPVGWAEHLRWLNETLESDNRKLFIIQVAYEFAGQVRLDKQGDITRISVALTKKYRGKGLGTEAICKVLDEVDSDVIAIIKKKNITSIRAHAKAGFGCDM